MSRIAPFAAIAALLAAIAPPAPAQPPPPPEPGPPDCADWKSGEFSLFFRSADADAVRSCLREGADINARSGGGRTPLHSALAETGDLGVVIALLEGGAAVNAPDSGGTTPLHIAAASPGKARPRHRPDRGGCGRERAGRQRPHTVAFGPPQPRRGPRVAGLRRGPPGARPMGQGRRSLALRTLELASVRRGGHRRGGDTMHRGGR